MFVGTVAGCVGATVGTEDGAVVGTIELTVVCVADGADILMLALCAVILPLLGP